MTPAQPIQTQQDAPEQTAAPAQPTAPEPDDSADSDETAVAGEPVNLQKAYSKLNAAVTALFDGLGVRRSATVAHIPGQSMADHIGDLGKVLPTVGGMTANVLTATHTKHDPKGGATVLHPADKLRQTIVPKDSVEAKAAIAACRNFVSKAGSLIGETPEVKLAKAQIQMISAHDMAGMSAFDAGAALLSVPGPLIQLIARKHSEAKHGGEVHAKLTAPQDMQEGAGASQGGAQGGGETSEAQPAAPEAPGAPAAAPPAQG